MQPIKKVNFAIGIQARSTSERLPEKVFADICGKPMLQWVMDAAFDCAKYNNRPNLNNKISVSTSLLIPDRDKIKNHFSHSMEILEGSEFDVLSRYVDLAEYTGADYIVRITGDCPLLPPPLITKAIMIAHMNKYDYVSNVDARLRLSADGHDVEVISKRLLKFVDENAKSKSDREHVTTFVRNGQLPSCFSVGYIVGYLDLADVKLSVDTEQDLERVRTHARKMLDALDMAKKLSGGQNAHRF